MLPSDAILNIDTLSELLASGHSRVPVHVPGNRCAATIPVCLSPDVLKFAHERDSRQQHVRVTVSSVSCLLLLR